MDVVQVILLGKDDNQWTLEIPVAEKQNFINELQSSHTRFIGVTPKGLPPALINKDFIDVVEFIVI